MLHCYSLFVHWVYFNLNHLQFEHFQWLFVPVFVQNFYTGPYNPLSHGATFLNFLLPVVWFGQPFKRRRDHDIWIWNSCFALVTLSIFFMRFCVEEKKKKKLGSFFSCCQSSYILYIYQVEAKAGFGAVWVVWNIVTRYKNVLCLVWAKTLLALNLFLLNEW